MEHDLQYWASLLAVGGQGWLVQLLILLTVASLVHVVVNRVLASLLAKLERTPSVWDYVLAHAARRPLQLILWAVAFMLAAVVIDQRHGLGIAESLQPLNQVGVVVLLTWFLWRLIKRSESALVDPQQMRKPMDATTVGAIGKLLRLTLLVITVLVVLQTFGYSVSGLLAFGGIGGIAVGFAAKDLLANFFGGLMIYLDRPFKVGDWIRSPDQEIEGTVEEIGWRQTRIRTFSKRPLYVPNSTFANISVENPSRMTNRRIFETVGIRYEDADKAEKIVAEVKLMLQHHADIDTSQTLIVNLNAFSPSSLDFFIYTFTKTTDWVRFHEIKQDVMLKVIDIVAAQGAEMAYPTSTVHLASMPETTS